MKKIYSVVPTLVILCLLANTVLSNGDNEETNSDRVILVDTGYDLCISLQGKNCEKNRNLLVRGPNLILDHPNNVDFNKVLTSKLWKYMNKFSIKNFQQLGLHDQNDIVKSYRIIVISLIYGEHLNPKKAEQNRQILFHELNQSKQFSTKKILPKRFEIYGLNSLFDSNKFAFIWHPITLYSSKEASSLDSLIKLSGELTSLLLNEPPDGKPLLIYYHCIAGKDRTGAVTMAYYMTYGGYRFQKNNRSPRMRYDEALISSKSDKLIYPNPKARKLAYRFCNTLPDAKQYCTNYWFSELELLLDKKKNSWGLRY